MKVLSLLALSLLTFNSTLGRAQTQSTLTLEQAVDVLDHYREYVVHAPARDTLRRAGHGVELGLLLIGADVATQAFSPVARHHVRTRKFGPDSAEMARQAFKQPLHFGVVSRLGTAVVAGSVVYAGVRFVAIGLSRLFGRPALPDEAHQMRKYLALPKHRQLDLARRNPRLEAAVIELAEIMRGLPAYTPIPTPAPVLIPAPTPEPSPAPEAAPAPNSDAAAEAQAQPEAPADGSLVLPHDTLRL